MTSAWVRTVCRLSIVLSIWTPYQVAQAGMIGTDQVVLTAQADRGTVLNFLSRSDVAGQLQAFGLDAATARDRVASMSDEEVRYLSGQIGSLPAGADNAGLIVLVLVIGLIAVGVWWYMKRM